MQWTKAPFSSLPLEGTTLKGNKVDCIQHKEMMLFVNVTFFTFSGKLKSPMVHLSGAKNSINNNRLTDESFKRHRFDEHKVRKNELPQKLF